MIDGLDRESVTALSAGCSHMACVTDDGLLYTWGSDANAKLGLGLSRPSDHKNLQSRPSDHKKRGGSFHDVMHGTIAGLENKIKRSNTVSSIFSAFDSAPITF